MNVYGSGFFFHIVYATQSSAVDDSLALLTESSLNILTETGLAIDES